jgi:hypothetical protein
MKLNGIMKQVQELYIIFVMKMVCINKK